MPYVGVHGSTHKFWLEHTDLPRNDIEDLHGIMDKYACFRACMVFPSSLSINILFLVRAF